jgi:tRNA-specific adenosine deaminase 1
MKSLPRSKLDTASGIILHDTHAEVLAIRSFNVFLMRECSHLLDQPGNRSKWVYQRHAGEKTQMIPQAFGIREDVKIWMYGSEAPCGDASVEVLMRGMDDITPWERKPAETSKEVTKSAAQTDQGEVDVMMGRGYFGELGKVRRKPGNHLYVVLHLNADNTKQDQTLQSVYPNLAPTSSHLCNSHRHSLL